MYPLGSRSPLIIDFIVLVQVKKLRKMLWVMGVYFLLSILGYGISNPQIVLKKRKKWCKVFIRKKVLITNSPKIEPGRNQSGKLGKGP